MILLDDLFEMHGGYVLDFSNSSFSHFFLDELQIDIDDQKYCENGTSKGKRFKCFLRKTDGATASRALNAIWEYREAVRQRRNEAEKVLNARERLFELMRRLDGSTETTPRTFGIKKQVIDPSKTQSLMASLMELSSIAPQPRGYAFEKFLKELFDAYCLEAREPFRLRGEQIDGSFLLGNETYLLEAKWQNLPSAAAELRAFNAKAEEKAAWTRGLFVAYSGFSSEGLDAFGRGKRVICMDGLDLFETLQRGLPLPEVLEKKVRRAAETGKPFIRVAELFQ
jgi:hypothetical protein